MAETHDNLPIEKWTESHVSSWLRSIGVKEQYIKKLHEEEVDGQILKELSEDFLKKETGMKSGPALLIIKKRNELVESLKGRKVQKDNRAHQTSNSGKGSQNEQQATGQESTGAEIDETHPETKTQADKDQPVTGLLTKRDCKPRPFGKEGIDFTYVKHSVLQPESGVIDLISPCHEYKSLSIAAKLDRTRLQAKFAKEVLKFGTGCMNIRSNGTIHFGVMDSRDDAGYVHGEIIGVPVTEKDIYVDALDHIERCFSSADSEHVRQCIRPPQFIEVMDMNSTEKFYVVEVDIVPSVSIVRNRVYSVRLPNFKEKANKVEHEKDTVYRRVGSKTEPVSDQNEFYQRVRDRDAQREEAEHSHFLNAPDFCEDLGRKLTMLVTSGKKFIEKEKWYILITNKFQQDDLSSIDFLLNMKIFCVFDFDPDSKVSGFCGKYLQHHAANLHFMQNYKIPSGMSIGDFVSHLHLFEQTSWIFCNGRNDYHGSETPCDEMTWIKTKITLLRESVSLICKQLLPKGAFSVIFLLTSPVEKPLLHIFYEFYTDMEGHEDIICISECEENYQKWKSFAEAYCDTATVNRSSVVGMRMSHVNATLQRIQPVTTRATKHLSVFTKGECLLETREEERMYSLEILSVDQCEETSNDFIEAEKDHIERHFYHGSKVSWLNFWLAEKKFVGDVIQRDAYREVSELLSGILKRSADQMPVNSINIYHHPGSGGSTVARQVLWNHRKDLRCAVVKPSYSAAVVSEHAVHLREYEEKDLQKCLPVLLLVEDCDNEYLDDLRHEVEVAVNTKKIVQGTVCFILLSCRRSHTPEKMCKESPLQNVAVTHKLSEEEKRQFAGKRKKLEEHYQPEFILTFVLMSEEFEPQYVKDFVEHLLQGIDHTSVVTRLIHYVALLNTYVQNSFISQSHCEALLALTIHLDRFRQHNFERSLSEQAKLVFIHLRDEKTYIESIRIIHPLVAKEILQQLLGSQQQQSAVAMDLLHEDVLFEHRFGKEEYVKFLRALFMRRCRISKGDESDSFFSPLIEHVRENESPDKAIELLKEAYARFNKDAFFAQQLARLIYRYDRFEEAIQWAEIAAKKMPRNSYILDTKGQVYRRWFLAKCKVIENVTKTPENTADAIQTALTAMECFEACEVASVSDLDTVNNSGFFAAVEVGCNLLKLIFSLQMFSNKTVGRTECLKYLVTDYIPEKVNKPWECFHSKLKSLQVTMHGALEWISEDLSYFQTDISADEEETAETEMKINNPKNWLVNKSSVYGKYFSGVPLNTVQQSRDSSTGTMTPFMKRMLIYRLGGGNITTIFSLLHDQKDGDQIKVLEEIISLYPSDPLKARLEQMDLVNYIASQIALGCLSTQSSKLVALQNLQNLCQQFPNDKRKCLSSALFLLTLLFWPEDSDPDKENKYEIVMAAVEYLKRSYWTKMKDIPQRKRRIYTHFFLSNGSGWDKIVHKSKVESLTKLLSVSEKRMKWLRGEVWKMPEIATLLKSVHGWTEDGTVFLLGPQKKFNIPALNSASVPYGNENVTFYLGFTFRGPVAYNITVIK
ncbi:sterile alpha motif domain-containing protein 9-like [Megalops cyprinoides]|uniref:sterile alpha motif domain-containing protein 9-like n=1 Tax=Megalops cyprinoides TaxID=118141 RepID=UPI001864E57F|nr:sterile alpha motif domain-containing protein 9-like [Megalops cyprinoides]